MMTENELDNMDNTSIKDVGYYIWRMCEHIEESNVMGTEFKEACRNIAEEEFPHLEWSDLWNEIEQYL